MARTQREVIPGVVDESIGTRVPDAQRVNCVLDGRRVILAPVVGRQRGTARECSSHGPAVVAPAVADAAGVAGYRLPGGGEKVIRLLADDPGIAGAIRDSHQLDLTVGVETSGIAVDAVGCTSAV